MAITGKGLPRSLKDANLQVSTSGISDAGSVGKTLMQASTQAQGRSAIGAVAVGTTAGTAMAGNKVPTATERGGVLLQAAQPDVSAAPTQQDYNDLLAKLRAAGILTA